MGGGGQNGRITIRPHEPSANHVTRGRWIGRRDWKPGFPHRHPRQMWLACAEPAPETVRLWTRQTERGGRRFILFEGSFKGCL